MFSVMPSAEDAEGPEDARGTRQEQERQRPKRAELHEQHDREEQRADPRSAVEVGLDAALVHRRVAVVAVDREAQIVGGVRSELAGGDALADAREERFAAVEDRLRIGDATRIAVEHRGHGAHGEIG
jgi:hypothetical protein